MCKDRRSVFENGDWVPVLGKKGVRTVREESHEGGSEKSPYTNHVLVSLFVDSITKSNLNFKKCQSLY